MTQKIHPRTRIVSEAHVELSNAVISVIEKHNLTYAELWYILTQIAASWVKHAISDERVSDTDSEA
jgi:hypothetical protein